MLNLWYFSCLLQAYRRLPLPSNENSHNSPGTWRTSENIASPHVEWCNWRHRLSWKWEERNITNHENVTISLPFYTRKDFMKKGSVHSKKPHICVPISLTSWWITSSMQHSGLSSATALFDAERLSLCELVCRSAWTASQHTAELICGKLKSVWETLDGKVVLPLQECLLQFGCCHCAHLCNWRRSLRGKYFCVI